MDKATHREIEAECVALSHAWAFHIDHKQYEALADLFVPDGVFIRTGVRLEGREAILAAMHNRPAEQFTRHVTTNFHFTEVTENQARATFYNMSYYAFLPGSPPHPYAPERMMLLDFVDQFVRTPEGWRFQERDARAVLIPEDLKSRLPAAAFESRS
jgi:uncharacterized protein (TIGR02246 family)